MAFHFTCPYCFKKTLVDEALAGQAGPCISCGKTVTVPPAPVAHPATVRPVDGPTIQLETNASLARRRLLVLIVKVSGLTAAVALLSGLTIYVLWPTLDGLKARRDKAACMNNLQLLATALNAYAAQHGSYPTPTVYDANGKPLYSWRVLILKQLGEHSLAAAFKLDEAWDSASNIQLLGQRCPRVFISPGVPMSRGISETNYFLLTGPGTLFPPSGPLSPNNITDGGANTLLIVESENSFAEWSRPIDIDVSKLDTNIGSTGLNTIGGTHAGGATAVFANATPAWLPDDLTPGIVDALISPNGGEPVDPTRFELR
jgi:hypothetical protein